MVNTFDINDRIELRVEYLNAAAVAADPTEVTIRVTDPSGNTSEDIYNGGAGNVIKDATGDFNLPQTLDEAGRWAWSHQSTGIVTYDENFFYVRDRSVPDPA